MGAWSLKLRFGTHVGIAVLLFAGILTVVALIAEKHPYRWDLTEQGIHTLSPQTRKVLENIEDDIRIHAFYFQADHERSGASDLLNSYKYLSPKISVQFVDPELQPSIVRQYEVKSAGTIVVEGYGRTQTITLPTEESLTNAIIQLKSTRERTVYFLDGHGERDIDDTERSGYFQLREAMEKEGYITRKLLLMREAAVPEDAAVVIIADPRKSLLETELSSLARYLEDGGRLLVMLQPFQDAGLEPWLSAYGVRLGRDIVIDPLSRAMGGDYLVPIVTTAGTHKISENTRANMLFPETRSVTRGDSVPGNVTVHELVHTSPGSWAETDMDSLRTGEVRFNEGVDLQGPFTVGLAITMSPSGTRASVVEDAPSTDPVDEDPSESLVHEDTITAAETDRMDDEPGLPKGKLVIFGNSDFASNTFLSMLGNRDLILNTIGFLAEDEDRVSIRPKRSDMQTLTLSRNQSRLLFWVSLVLVPAAVLLAGASVYRYRRRNK